MPSVVKNNTTEAMMPTSNSTKENAITAVDGIMALRIQTEINTTQYEIARSTPP